MQHVINGHGNCSRTKIFNGREKICLYRLDSHISLDAGSSYFDTDDVESQLITRQRHTCICQFDFCTDSVKVSLLIFKTNYEMLGYHYSRNIF